MVVVVVRGDIETDVSVLIDSRKIAAQNGSPRRPTTVGRRGPKPGTRRPTGRSAKNALKK